jgi:hypothetical protein
MEIKEFHVLCEGPIFNLCDTSKFKMFPLLCDTTASYIRNCNVLTATNAIVELQIQITLNTLPHDFVSDHRHSTLLPFSIHQITYNFIYAVRATENKP